MRFLQKSLFVIPAKAGIQDFQGLPDLGAHFGLRSEVRRAEGFLEFCRRLL
jgi:hypothetical protein